MTCLFCRIAAGEVPAAMVYQDDAVFAFRDIRPQAPLHVLVCPRQHIATLNELSPEHDVLVGRMLRAAKTIAAQEGIAEPGYRTVFNCGVDAGQTVFHIHLHVLGGRVLTWPPG